MTKSKDGHMLGNIQTEFAKSVSQRRKTIWPNRYYAKMHFRKLNPLSK